jgi:hypothetical protein
MMQIQLYYKHQRGVKAIKGASRIYTRHVRILLQIWPRVLKRLLKCNMITCDSWFIVTIPNNDDVHRKFEAWPTSQTPDIQSLLRLL